MTEILIGIGGWAVALGLCCLVFGVFGVGSDD